MSAFFYQMDWESRFEAQRERDAVGEDAVCSACENLVADCICQQLREEEEERREWLADHVHTCQQCDTVVIAHCDCGKPIKNIWCSSNCRAAFDL